MELNNRDVVYLQNNDEYQKKNKIIKHANQTAISHVNPDICFETYEVNKKTFDMVVEDGYQTEIVQEEQQVGINNVVLNLFYDYIELYINSSTGGEIIWGDGETTIFTGPTDDIFEHSYDSVGNYTIVVNCPELIEFTVRDLDDMEQETNEYQLTIQFNQNPNLERIELDDTFLTSIAFNNVLPSVTYLKMDNNYLTQVDFSNTPNLTYLNINDNELTSFSVSNLPMLGYLNLSGNFLSTVTISNLNNLEDLYLGNNSLTSATISSTSLQNLYMNNNQFTTLTLSNLNSLIYLDLNNNQLTSLTLNSLPSLQNLNLIYNQFTTLTLSNLNSLIYLDLTSNQLTSLTLNSVPSLQNLNLSYNQFVSLTVDSPNLTNLYCSNNPLTSLTINTNSIQYLDCNQTNLFNLNLSGKTNLISLYAFNNYNLFNVNLTNCSNLVYLNLYYCDIVNGLTITGCVKLTEIYLGANMIDNNFPNFTADAIVQLIANTSTINGGILNLNDQRVVWDQMLYALPLTSRSWQVFSNNPIPPPPPTFNLTNLEPKKFVVTKRA